MKRTIVTLVLCGIVLAGITSNSEAAPNWWKYLPRPIIMPPPDSVSNNGELIMAAPNWWKYLPRPIIIPSDSFVCSESIRLTALPVSQDPPPPPWIRRTLTAHQNEFIIVKKPTTGTSNPGPIDRRTTTRFASEQQIAVIPQSQDPPPFPWIRKTLTA